MDKGGIEALKVCNDVLDEVAEAQVVGDFARAERQLVLELVEDVLDGAVDGAVGRAQEHAVPGKGHGVEHDRALVRGEVVPHERARGRRGWCSGRSR